MQYKKPINIFGFAKKKKKEKELCIGMKLNVTKISIT